jgi:uncharacterized protein
MRLFVFFLFCLSLLSCNSVSPSKFARHIEKHRAEYKQDFLQNERSPLVENDFQFLDFFEPDKKFRFLARVEFLDQQDTLSLKTSAGKIKHYMPFALLKFSIDDMDLQLYAYTSLDLNSKEEYKDYLFIPFTDETNGNDTYGGGRYLDLNKKDIRHGRIILDFNKAYNPWCAFSTGYNCPIPPLSNDLSVPIKAGAKKFKVPVKKK